MWRFYGNFERSCKETSAQRALLLAEADVSDSIRRNYVPELEKNDVFTKKHIKDF